MANLDIASRHEPPEGALKRPARDPQFLCHPALRAHAPALAVDMAAEEGQHLEVRPLKRGIGDRIGWNDGVAGAGAFGHGITEGSLLPFRWLHERQRVCRLPMVVGPPEDSGNT